MSDYVRSGQAFTLAFNFGESGLVGTLEASIYDLANNEIEAASIDGIVESPPNSGVYAVTHTITGDPGYYTISVTDGDTILTDAVVVVGGNINLPDGSVIVAPSAENLRDWTLVNLENYGFPDDDAGNGKLQRLINQTCAWLERVSGWSLGTLPASYVAQAETLIEQIVIWNVFRKQPDAIESRNDYDLVQSFTAGDYSETHRGLHAGDGRIHADPDINNLLGLFLNPAKRGTLAPGVARPVEPDWNIGKDVMSVRSPASAGFGYPGRLDF